jgi:hypothetical protein
MVIHIYLKLSTYFNLNMWITFCAFLYFAVFAAPTPMGVEVNAPAYLLVVGYPEFVEL